MKNLRHFIRKHSKYSLILALVVLLLFVAAVAYLLMSGHSSDRVWLPDKAKYESASDTEVLFDLPVKSEDVTTEYGLATRYTSHNNWQTIYEFSSSPLLEPSSCPNITNSETLLPSGCDKLGTFQGQPVYAMHRSLPSGATEYYVKLEQTFIYIKSGGDGGESLDYLNTFVSLPHNKVSSYLADNAKRVNAIKERQ